MRRRRAASPGESLISILVTLAGPGAALLLALAVVAAPWASSHTDAQAKSAVLTGVGTDGTLRLLDGDRWVTVADDVAHGATVTALAWHPSRPEILVVRRTMAATRSPEPSYALVRIELASGSEETILDGVGPQAQILGPRFAPDGTSAFARVECCLARQILRFGVPPAATAPTQGTARAFLPQDVADDTNVWVGPFAADGRILMSVFCCMGDEPSAETAGLYLVDPDIKHGERIASDITGAPLGLGPDGAWVAILDESHTDGKGPALVVVDLPSGRTRTQLPPTDPPLAPVGEVAPDGRIVVAQHGAVNDPWGPLGTLAIVQPDGTHQQVPMDGTPAITAFAWADADVIAKARLEDAAKARPIRVYFSRHPESDNDFSAVFPVDRMAPDEGVAGAALHALIAGPTDDEKVAGYSAELGAMLTGPSNCGGDDFALRIADGTATVQFCRLVTSAGVGQDGRARSTIEATLRQFSTVQRVRLLTYDDNCLFDMSGENRCLSN